jgi:hypothetical protein
MIRRKPASTISATAKGSGGLDQPSKPRGVSMVLRRVQPMRVAEDVDIRQLHGS